MNNAIPQIRRYSRIFARVQMEHVDLFFSYDTLVAFQWNHPNEGVKMVVAMNRFGSVTGRHLNEIDGGSLEARGRRVNAEEFTKQVKLLNL